MDRPLRVFVHRGLTAPTGGFSPVDHYRWLEPLAWLTPRGFECRYDTSENGDKAVERFMENLDWCDVLFIVRAVIAAPYLPFLKIAQYQFGKAIIVDQDDYWIPDHPDPVFSRDTLPALLELFRLADLMTASTPELARRLRGYNKNVMILPNAIARPEHWQNYRFNNGPLVVGTYGTVSHLNDWLILADALKTVAKRFPRVTFAFGGTKPPAIAGVDSSRIQHLPPVPYGELPELLQNFDVICCPLHETRFSACKSPIKWLEASMMGIPTVCSPTVYRSVVRHGETGLIAWNRQDWVHCLSRLIEDAELRRRIAEAAYVQVQGNHNLETTGPRWEYAFRGVVKEEVHA